MIVLALVGCSTPDLNLPTQNTDKTQIESNQSAPELQPLQIGDQQFFVEIADTPDERQMGLMHRESMPANQGMLFVWPEEGSRNFWMKNTLIPLDMIWINTNREIVDIKAAEPCKVEDCPTYPGGGPAQFVLELNQGVFRGQVGDRVEF